MSDDKKQMINEYYDELVDKVQNHFLIPSFARMNRVNAPSYELTDNGGALSVTLTDNNDVLYILPSTH